MTKLSELGYSSRSTAALLRIETQADVPADITAHRNVEFKRGGTFTVPNKFLTGTHWGAFGNAKAPKPVMHQGHDGVTENNKVNNISIEDLDFRGSKRHLYFGGSNNIRILRCNFQDNLSQQGQGTTFRGGTGINIQQCTSKNTYGDVFYMLGVHDVYIAHNNLGNINGGGADHIQITHEHKGYMSSNIIIEHNICAFAEDSTAYKGNIVMVGIKKDANGVGAIIRNNTLTGRYFSIGVGGTGIEVYDNEILATDKAIQYGYGIGISGTEGADDITIRDNIISNAKRGIIMSVADPANLKDIIDINIHDNKIDNCDKGIFYDVPFTGLIENNTIADCGIAYETRQNGGKLII